MLHFHLLCFFWGVGVGWRIWMETSLLNTNYLPAFSLLYRFYQVLYCMFKANINSNVFGIENPEFPLLTNKPAIVALLHHIHNVALLQLQLILVARHVVVHGLVPV